MGDHRGAPNKLYLLTIFAPITILVNRSSTIVKFSKLGSWSFQLMGSALTPDSCNGLLLAVRPGTFDGDREAPSVFQKSRETQLTPEPVSTKALSLTPDFPIVTSIQYEG
jgi:hypothetical protein